MSIINFLKELISSLLYDDFEVLINLFTALLLSEIQTREGYIKCNSKKIFSFKLPLF